MKNDRGTATLFPAWGVHVVAPIALVLVGLGVAGNSYYLTLATSGAIAYILTAAFNLIYGYAGIFNLSIIVTYGLGAFTSVYLEVAHGLSFWIAVPTAVLLSGLVSVLVALPSRGLGELFLAIQTLAFALALGEVLLNWEEFSGGTIGIFSIPSPRMFGTDLWGGTAEFYWLVALVVWLVFELMLRIHRSSTGRQLVALREGPRVLASVGVSPERARLVAFWLSGLLAGLAGALYAHFQLVIDLETFSFHRLVALLLATILGGAGYFWGPLFGVLSILVMDELSLATSQAQDLVYGVGILVLVIWTSGGLAGALQRSFRTLLSRWRPGSAQDPGASEPSISAGPALARELVASMPGVTSQRNITLHDMSVEFGGTKAVDNVSISFATGEVVGLIGPNGAGKTTLLNTITGDVRVTRGSIRLDDRELVGLKPQELVRLGVGRTFQSPKVIPDLTLLQNVLLAGDGASNVGWTRQTVATPAARRAEVDTRDRAMELLGDFSLGSRAHALAGDQPYGVLRLVEVARNLMLSPAFLLLDEPGAGLTEFEREEIAATVRALAISGIGVVLVDHNLPLINAACDRIYVLDTGRLIASGRPADVFAEQHVISAYLGVPQ